MFQDVHDGGPASVAGARPGDILLEVDGAVVRPPTLPTFALGKDVPLTIDREGGQVQQVPVILPKPNPNGKANATPPMAEPTSVTARTLGTETGYLRIAFFPGANGQRFARELDRALAELSGCTRLIIDLRGNLGGFVGSLRLMSYLTPDRIPVGYSLTRSGEDRKRRPDQLASIDRLPETTLDMLKMAFRFKVVHRDRSIRLVTEGLGPKPFHGRIVMLVNEHTLSAGEMVAAFTAENGLATLVGTRDRRPGARRRQLFSRSRVHSSAAGGRLVHLARLRRRRTRSVAERRGTAMPGRTSARQGRPARSSSRDGVSNVANVENVPRAAVTE